MKLSKAWLITAFTILLTGILYSQLTPSPIPPNPGGIANGTLLGDPRSPISSLPFTIDRCGSYFVTDCLVGAAGFDGITIDADDVTIDLNGFSLIGVTGSLEGIRVVPSHANVSIFNGVVRDWDGDGVNLQNAIGSQCQGLRVFNNAGTGIFLGGSSIADNCVATSNGLNGIEALPGSIVQNCIARLSGAVGIEINRSTIVIGNTLLDNANAGISAEIGGGGNIIERNVVSGTTSGDGIRTSATSLNNRIVSNSVQGNSNRGIVTLGDENFVIRNTSSQNAGLNYQFVGNGDAVGEVLAPPAGGLTLTTLNSSVLNVEW